MVFVEQAPGQFERREVVLGARRGDMVPVLSGLSAGERVVVDGQYKLRQNSLVSENMPAAPTIAKRDRSS